MILHALCVSVMFSRVVYSCDVGISPSRITNDSSDLVIFQDLPSREPCRVDYITEMGFGDGAPMRRYDLIRSMKSVGRDVTLLSAPLMFPPISASQTVQVLLGSLQYLSSANVTVGIHPYLCDSGCVLCSASVSHRYHLKPRFTLQLNVLATSYII
jgi:hypothetical protein